LKNLISAALNPGRLAFHLVVKKSSN